MKNKNLKPKKNTDFASYAIICRLLMSFSSYLLTSCILIFVFYIVGNFQNFTDIAQVSILTVLTILSIMMLVSSIAGLIANIVFLIARVRVAHRIICSIVFIFIIIFGIIFLVFSTFLTQLSSGVLTGF